ncbi:MAG: hypothetical protein M3445_03000, partial [Actinomycetota bacterium]|nr:hypothetical protein [Actinomycetota bacterium]
MSTDVSFAPLEGVAEAARSARRGLIWAMIVFAATVAQLLVATFVPGLDQFEGKAFGARLVAYPLMMLVAPAAWWLVRRQRGSTYPMPWAGFALIMAPFLIDVSGNTLDFYDTLEWWDDANHFFNWILLCWGFGLLIVRGFVSPRWALVLTVTGLGALLAIGWELGEWFSFIRQGTELGMAYEDTLADEALGSLGALVAGLFVARSHGTQRRILRSADQPDA